MSTAVVSLDIINEITHAGGKLASYVERIESENIISNINKINRWARQQDYLVIHVRVGFDTYYAQSSVVSPLFKRAKESRALCLSEWGCEYHPQLDVMSTDIHVIKHRISAFYGTDLDLICRANQIKRLILTGVSTSMAVELTAREAHDRDYQVVVVSDATTCAADEEKQASLSALQRLCQLKSTELLMMEN